jgi:glycosyltransferase involved in cell wall biosynthesis
MTSLSRASAGSAGWAGGPGRRGPTGQVANLYSIDGGPRAGDRRPSEPRARSPVTSTAVRWWIVLEEGSRLRWGGDLRRYYLLRPLARMARARFGGGWTSDVLSSLLDASGSTRPHLASTELLDDEALLIATRRTRPTVVDLHDEPIAHAAALGHELTVERTRELSQLFQSNVEAFRTVICQSPEFVRLVGLEPRRTFIATSGTDTRWIVPGPWPAAPVVGMVSGASPGRGIEALVAACRILRADSPDLRLELTLAGTTDAGREYLAALIASIADEPWIGVKAVPYREIGPRLAEATVLVIPHPANPYWDAVLPIKLFDYLAAGRPIVATPRSATAALLESSSAGIIAKGDGLTDIAEAIARVLGDEPLARQMGGAGRIAAQTRYDWSVVGRRLANEILRREDRVRWIGERVRVARNRIRGWAASEP